jgi:hypothetical protein
MHTLSVEECFNSDEEESSEVCVDDFFAPPSTEDAQGSVLSVQSEPAPFVAPTTAWPLLATRGAHKEDVQCMVFELWCAYNAFRASTALHQLGDKFRFGDVFIPIFDRPPGYKGVKSQMLKYEILQSHYGTLGMQRAVCVIDHASNNTEARQYGDRVSFAGPRARTLYDTPFHDGEKQLFVARMGGDNVPHDSTVKAWRYDAVQHKNDPTAEWYICLFLPYRKAYQPRKRKRT